MKFSNNSTAPDLVVLLNLGPAEVFVSFNPEGYIRNVFLEHVGLVQHPEEQGLDQR